MAAQPQKPIAHEPTGQHPPDPRPHPVKPRRSLKIPKPLQEEEQRNQTVMKRVSPAASSTLLWFERSQLPRLRRPGQELPCWLHGFTTRREAEELLKGKPQGCFLLRLSETQTGFVLSYRGRDRCRHFMIEEEEGGNYLIAGEESHHASLQELVSFYAQNPIGPFEEMLTSPFTESSEVCDDARKLKDEDGRDATIPHETPLSSPSKPVGPESDRTPEYAVVKKALKKSYSLPEHQLGEHILSCREEEFNIPHLLTQDDSVKADNSRAGLHESDNHIADAQYAKVNKPARTTRTNTSLYVNINTLPQQQGATDASVLSTGGPSAEDPGYWGLEPPHTYEETPYRDQQESCEEIDFYAVGRWRDIEGNAALLQHHLYSEVNLRGTRGGRAHRAAPSLPSRPPPPTAISCPQLDAQRCEDPLMPSPSRRAFSSTHPQRSLTGDSPTIIYEEIPEMSAGSKPPLPPPNPKHSK